MTDYNKSTNFAVKDGLQSGDPNKIVSGAEIDTEFNNISSSSTTKIDKVSSAVTDNLASFTAKGNIKDSGKDVTDFADATDTENRLSTNESDISDLQSNKANKVSGATSGNFASLGSDGDLQDSSENATTIINIASPTGAVTAFAASNPPTGWLECDGSAVSRTTYADLFAVIGTSFGVGDASTTFNLPDLRGEFIRGWDNGKGTDVNRSFASSQEDTFQGHNFEVRTFTNGETANVSRNNGVSPNEISNGSSIFSPDVFPLADTPVSDGINGTPRISNETRPRNVAMMYIIKT